MEETLQEIGWCVLDAGTEVSLCDIEAQYAIMDPCAVQVVAYAFDAKQADLLAAAPSLLYDLQEAAKTLRHYEALHRAKNTEESTKKAEVNAALAARFEATIAKATGGAS